MLRPRRFENEVDPGPVQIQARKVHFDVDRHPVALDTGTSCRVQRGQPAQRGAARGRALVRRHLQRGAAAGEGSAAGRGHARLHRPGSDPRRCARADAARVHGRQRDRPEADARTDRVLVLQDARAVDVHRSEASAQPPVRSAVVHRRDRALHRRDGRLRTELRLGRLRRRPDDGRPVPLARQRGSRASQRRP